jgi:hypothetical protein
VPRSSSRTRSTAIGLVLAGIVAAFAGYGAALWALGSMRLDFDLFSASDRRHLDEIPIDRARACGSVESIHDALANLNTSYTAATLGLTGEQFAAIWKNVPSSTAPPSPVTQSPWPTVAADLDASAARLDLIVAAGIPNFPPRAQRELQAIRTNIAEGRAVLPKVEDAGSLNLTRPAFERGQLHAGYASDLVGDQCPVPLGA